MSVSEDLATPERIINAAEALFAKNGIAAVSLRSIISLAGVNIAAAHYHFGSKDELIKAVLNRRITQINAERMRRLSNLRTKYTGGAVPVRELLYAFLAPALEAGRGLGNGTPNFFSFIARAHAEADQVVQAELFSKLKEVVATFVGELRRTLPDCAPSDCATRLVFCVGAMFQAVLLPTERLFGAKLAKEMPGDEELLNSLVDFCEGGFLAERSKSK